MNIRYDTGKWEGGVQFALGLDGARSRHGTELPTGVAQTSAESLRFLEPTRSQRTSEWSRRGAA